jgi:hypothetical protein
LCSLLQLLHASHVVLHANVSLKDRPFFVNDNLQIKSKL